MLSDIYIGRTIVAPQPMNIHAHATFSCGVAKFFARVRAVFSR